MIIEIKYPPAPEAVPDPELFRSESRQFLDDMTMICGLVEAEFPGLLKPEELVAVTTHFQELKSRATNPDRDQIIMGLERKYSEQESIAQSAKFGEVATKHVLSNAMREKFRDVDGSALDGHFRTFDPRYRDMINDAHRVSAQTNSDLNTTYHELCTWKDAQEIMDNFVQNLSEGTVMVPGVVYRQRGKLLEETHTHA